MIEIELRAPARLNRQPVPQQSLWLLLRLWCIDAGHDPQAAGWLRESQLRERFGAARSNPRMLISRAFADFARWGVRVGWGVQRDRPLAMLALAGRNRGPFWLAPGEAARIRVLLDGKPASASEVLTWLDCRQDSSAPTDSAAVAAPAGFWHHWAAAKREMLQGRLIVNGDTGALAEYRLAQTQAGDAYHRALALLQQAMVWRRAGNADAARSVLADLDRHWHDVQAPEHAWLGAMAAIVSAWCAYAGRDPQGARRILHAASVEPRWALLFEHHPRVRSEYANLQALLQRATALREDLAIIEREQAASASLLHYQRALQQASEAELFDAAASAASNLGWSLWLFQRCGLRPLNAPAGPPLQWIALAASLSRQYGAGGSSWNTIYLLRMVREGGPETLRPRLDDFRRWPVLSPARFRALIAPVVAPLQHASWRELAAAELASVDAGRQQVDALQRANLLLETAWYSAHAGDAIEAEQSAERLRRRLRELQPVDRGFFRDALRKLPELTETRPRAGRARSRSDD